MANYTKVTGELLELLSRDALLAMLADLNREHYSAGAESERGDRILAYIRFVEFELLKRGEEA